MSKIIFLVLFLSTFKLVAQNDTIFKKDGNLIIGTITYVNENNIFYDLKKNKGDYISVQSVEEYSMNGKRIKSNISPIVFIINPNKLNKTIFTIKSNKKELAKLKRGEAIKCVFNNEGEVRLLISASDMNTEISYQILNVNVEYSKTYYLVCSNIEGETKLVEQEIGEEILSNIQMSEFNEDQNEPLEKSKSPQTFSSGSGFLLSSSGLIATNYHVIEKAKKIEVFGINGIIDKSFIATVLIEDKINDLAILKLDTNIIFDDSIKYTFKSTQASPGESVFVLGYPLIQSLGEEVKLTTGVVSSKTGYKGDITRYQISAPVQNGNSGGPVFDSNGYLIGIINSKVMGAENVSYAIKSNYLKTLIESAQIETKLNDENNLLNLKLEDKVKFMSKHVFLIKVSQ
jgi:S1-C subfamily serine protease